jgi:hypothetical protein
MGGNIKKELGKNGYGYKRDSYGVIEKNREAL